MGDPNCLSVRIINRLILALVLVMVVGLVIVLASTLVLATATAEQNGDEIVSLGLKSENCTVQQLYREETIKGGVKMTDDSKTNCNSGFRKARMGRNTRKREFLLKSLNGGFDGKENGQSDKKRKRPKKQRRRRLQGRRKLQNRRKVTGRNARKRLAVGRLRKLWLEGESYRNWKRKKSTELLLQQPESQVAIAQLWQQLIRQGDHWQDVYSGMHNSSFPFSLREEITKQDITELSKGDTATTHHLHPELSR